MRLGELIQNYIVSHDSSYRAFGKQSGLSPGYISMLINNENHKTHRPPVPSIKAYAGIANALGMTLDELFASIEDAPVSLKTERANNKAKAKPAGKAESPLNCDTPAIKAMETLVKYNVTSAPILPLTVLQRMPNVITVSFTEMADQTGLDHDNMVTMFGTEHQDAVTYIKTIRGEQQYIIAYNQRLPFYMLQLALARELGYITLGYGNETLDESRMTEIMYFARHLLCPRPLIQSMKEAGIPLTVESIGNVSGCYGRCLAGIRKIPGAHVPAELNQRVKEQFSGYISKLSTIQASMPFDKKATRADFGTYMDNYEE